MARGIIVAKPAGGSGAPSTAGKIMVTNPSTEYSTSAGGTSDATAVRSAEVNYGQCIDFIEGNGSIVGDYVDFIYDGVLATKVASTGTKSILISGSYSDNIVIAAGQSYTILDASLEGKITNNGGTLVVSGKTLISGKIEAPGANSQVFIDSGCAIEGKLEVISASVMTVNGSTIEGKIQSNGNSYASVKGCTIRGKLEVLNAKVCQCSGNNVQGDTNTPGCA